MRGDLPHPTQLASPCVGICRLDERTGWCAGCGRTVEELTLWRDLDGPARARVWALLPERKRALGLHWRLLPWTPLLALGRLAFLARIGDAAWTMGRGAAALALTRVPGRRLDARLTGDTLVVRTAGARLRLIAHPGLRVFELVDRAGRPERLALALHRARLDGLGPLPEGPDQQALSEAGRRRQLRDTGLGDATGRLYRRGADSAPAELVVIGPLGRLERDAQPEPPAASADEAALALPPDYAACASFRPADWPQEP